MLIIVLLIKFIYLLRIHVNQYFISCQYLIKKRGKTGLENLKDSKAFIEYSNNMQDVYKNIEDCSSSRKCNELIVFNDMMK